jgi:integrase/recombinase XerD
LRTHRDRAIVLAMVLGCLRRREVLGLRLGDLRVAERCVFVSDGKGGHSGSCDTVEHAKVYSRAEQPSTSNMRGIDVGDAGR